MNLRKQWAKLTKAEKLEVLGIIAVLLAAVIELIPWLCARRGAGQQVISTPSSTATATSTGMASPHPTHTPSPTPTGTLTPTPTDTLTPTPTDTLTPTPTDTLTPTPTYTPTPLPAPVLRSPEDRAGLSEDTVRFEWEWGRELAEDQHFEVRVWRDGVPEPALVHWEKNKSYEWREATPYGYYWNVVVMQETGRHPDGRAYGVAVSEESQTRQFEYWIPPPGGLSIEPERVPGERYYVVKVCWTDQSNNETGFSIDYTVDGKSATGHVGADQECYQLPEHLSCGILCEQHNCTVHVRALRGAASSTPISGSREWCLRCVL